MRLRAALTGAVKHRGGSGTSGRRSGGRLHGSQRTRVWVMICLVAMPAGDVGRGGLSKDVHVGSVQRRVQRIP